MSDFHSVCKLSDLKEGIGKTVSVKNKLIAVFLVEGKPCAVDDCCPHMGAPLSGGNVEDGIVTCPWHAWRFRLCDGTWVDNPRVKMPSYPTRVEGDDVQIQIPVKVPKPEEN